MAKPEPTQPGDSREIVLVIEDKAKRRRRIATRIDSELGEKYDVREAEDGRQAMDLIRSSQKSRIALIVVDLELGRAEHREQEHARTIELISALRKAVPKKTRIIAYTLQPLGLIEKNVLIQAGASQYVQTDNIEAVITESLLADALRTLETVSPLVARVFNTIDIGISIQSPDMTVMWANQKTKDETGVKDIVSRGCWQAYHGFGNRSDACIDCVAWKAKTRASGTRRLGGKHARPEFGRMFLPVKGKISCVEISAAPFMTADGTQVLAVIEATRFIKEEWENESPPHERLKTVIKTARNMGQEKESALPFVSVSVYYKLPDSSAFLLFDAATAPRAKQPDRVRRANTLLADEKLVLSDGQPRVVPPTRERDDRYHFYWSGVTSKQKVVVLIDVAYAERKPVELLTKDLHPYWEYVLEVFDIARASREEEQRRKNLNALGRFLTETREDLEKPNMSREEILELSQKCVREALGPCSIYVRSMDRETRRLKKIAGEGLYVDHAPRERALAIDGLGSGKVAANRTGYIEKEATVEKVRRYIEHPLTDQQLEELARITGYATLPLIFSDRVLGTFCVQCEDDALLLKSNTDFLESMAEALGSALGQLDQVKERARLSEHLRKVDEMMFATQRGSEPADEQKSEPAQEEKGIISAVCEMLFDLIPAEVVAYYRYHEPREKVKRFKPSLQGLHVEDSRLPKTMTARSGVIRQAVTCDQEVGVYYPDLQSDRDTASHRRLLDDQESELEKAFWDRVGSVVAWPVRTEGKVKGVLLAISFIPRWLSHGDAALVEAFAGKIGLCLDAKNALWRLEHERTALESIHVISGAMGRASTEEEMYRLLLLGVTAGECLGFSRAVLFLRQEDDASKFSAAYAVGSISHKVSKTRWAEANRLNLTEKIELCKNPPAASRPGDMSHEISELAIDLADEPKLAEKIENGEYVIRYRDDRHPFANSRIRQLLSPEKEGPVEYILIPLATEEGLVGLILADRAFIDSADIRDETIGLLGLLLHEWRLWLELRKTMKMGEKLAWGLTYSLRSRAGVLEAQLSNLRAVAGKEHAAAIAKMEQSIEFFKRAGTLASDHFRIEQTGLERSPRFDLRQPIQGIFSNIGDERILLSLGDQALEIDVDRRLIEDVILEILLNARDFTDADPAKGRIDVSVRREDNMARVDVVDNGKGIHPEIRPRLFELFQRYPAGRMGLGLAYAATIVRAYGGTIEEVGEWKKGAHFVVRLPLATETGHDGT